MCLKNEILVKKKNLTKHANTLVTEHFVKVIHQYAKCLIGVGPLIHRLWQYWA